MSEKVAAPAPRAPQRVTVAHAPQLARKCGCAPGAAHCSKCTEESKPALQRKASHADGGAARGIPAVVHRVLSSPGRTLDSDTRAFMESRFGYDFSDVRIHTGSDAAASAQAVGAHAYTIGGDIVFDAGKYDPHSAAGRQLLAHELTHTIQQSGVGPSSLDGIETTSPGDTSEREADDIARDVLSGGAPVRPAVAHGGGMMLARLATPKPVSDPGALAKLKAAGITEIEAAEENNKVLRRFEVQVLDLPLQKGPARAMKLWQDKTLLTRPNDDGTPNSAVFSGLETVVASDGHYRSELKAARSDPKTLRRFWLTNVGVGISHATTVWNKAGGVSKDFLDDPLPATAAPACQVDHIIELHIGGADAPPNMQMLSGPSNVASQAAIRSQIIGHTKIIREALKDAHLTVPNQVAVRYRTVNPQPGHTDPCTTVEDKVRAIAGDPNEKVAPTVDSDTDPYEITAMALPATLRYGKGQKTAAIQNDKNNDQFVGLVPGMRLVTLDVTKNTIHAELDDSGKARLPLTITKGGKVDLKVINKVVTIPQGAPQNIQFTFPYMSSGTITKLAFTPEGLHASGTLVPSFPLLSGVKLGIDVSPISFTATLAPNTPLRPPFKGLHFVEPNLTFPLHPEFKPSGSIGFYVGNKTKPLLGGLLVASVEGTDFVASADVTANVPLLEQGTGKVKYHRKHGWTSEIQLRTGGKKLIKEAAVDVSMDNDGITATGSITVGIPRGSDATLKIHRNAQGELTYDGEAPIHIPGLRPAKLTVNYSSKGLNIWGKAPFTLFEKPGTIDVWYANGEFGGAVKNFVFEKGRATVTLEELKYAKGNFSGRGGVTMPLGDKFTATGRVALGEDGQLAIAAAIKISKPIPLFDPIKGDYKFFEVGVDIPIPGASIGNLAGLIARVEGSLSAGYTIGPAVIQEAELAAGMSPFAKDTGAGVSFKGRITMPAEAYISGKVSGQVALSAFVAEIAGGISLEAKATLRALSDIRTDVLYTPQRFTFHGELNASLGLLLNVALTAYVVARAGLTEWFSTETRKDWTLGSWPFRPNLALTMQAAFDYASDRQFQMPTIAFNKPAIDGDKLVRGGFDQATPKETES
ncbi:MAG: hypothetical protein QOH21_1934 [Acidobacteriota bacterium]|nr:hypothetical protein [Acidobacteriota bacterium]